MYKNKRLSFLSFLNLVSSRVSDQSINPTGQKENVATTATPEQSYIGLSRANFVCTSYLLAIY